LKIFKLKVRERKKKDIEGDIRREGERKRE
jgi:hypothetical protein